MMEETSTELNTLTPLTNDIFRSGRGKLGTIFACFFPSNRSGKMVKGDPWGDNTKLEKCGEGKTGEVWKVEVGSLKTICAAKIILKAYLVTEFKQESRQRDLRNEVTILSKVNHPNILRLERVYLQLEHITVITELCSGGCLSERGRLTSQEAAHVGVSVANALTFLHRQGISHRDIKPENVMFQTSDRLSPVRVIDFGVAQRGGVLTGMTGSIEFLAPECFPRNAVYGKEVDLWSFGVTMYWSLVGDLPFKPPTKGPYVSLLEGLITKEDYSYPDDCQIPKTAKELVRQCIKADPAERISAANVVKYMNLRWDNGD